MHPDKFKEIMLNRVSSCTQTLLEKNEEYSRNGDRLHNFKAAAKMDDITPEEALWGMLRKHIVSVRDMILDINVGEELPTEKTMRDKFDDWHNYAYLLEGLIRERTVGTKEDMQELIKKI